MHIKNLVFLLLCFKPWMLESTAACIVEKVEKCDINVRLHLEEEKRILLSKGLDILTLRTEILERQMAQILQNTEKVSTNGGLTGADRCHCPSNYTSHTPLNLCFRLSKDKQTWESARQICESEGGHLAKINSTEILLYLKEQIRNSRYIPTGSSFVIVGGNDKEEEGIWRWADRELVDMKSPVWSPGEPQGGERENCMYLHSANYLAIDGTCSSMWYYICQIG